MTYAEYEALEGIRWSTLFEMAKSPKHFQHRLSTPREDKEEFRIGRAVHAAILEPDRFATDYVVYEGSVRRGKDWDAFRDANRDRDIITADQYEAAIAMSNAVHDDPVAMSYLQNGKSEVTMHWNDPKTALRCKARLDFVSDKAIVDLKTARDIDMRMFGNAAARYGYHGQAAFYSEGVHRHLGRNDLPFVFITVEKYPPFDVAIFVADPDEALYAGQCLVRELLDKVAECQGVGQWPGRYHKEMNLILPQWAFGDDGEDLDGLEFGDGAQ